MLLAPVARILRSLLPILAIIVLAGFSSGVQARSSSPIPDAAISTVVSAFTQKVGTVLYVSLTGQTSGGVWGSNPYTADSNLSAAATHAGLLAPGETRTIRLVVQPGQPAYVGSVAHGVSSGSYSSFTASLQLFADDGGDNPILPDPGTLRLYEGSRGGVFRFLTTGNSRAGGVWGTNSYTSDSALAAAAVHTGVLVDGQIGLVRVVVGAAQSNYVGSTANAVSSSSYGTYAGSYSVSNEAGNNALIAYPGMSQNPLADPGSLTAYRGRTLASIYFNVTGSLSGGVWGTGIYTDDSVLAAAAVHAGLLRPGQPGIVKVTIRNGLIANAAGVAYVGSVANGITSNSYGSYTASFSLSSPDGGLGSIARVTNAGTVRALVLENLSYQIATNPLATSFDATGLPAGLTINASSGLITGAALVSGDFPVQLLASNAEGTSNDTLLIRISEAPSTAITPRQLDLIGPLTVQAGAKTIVSATARYTDNSIKTVAPLWISSNPGAATVSTLGVLKTGSVSVDTDVVLTAFWRENGVTVQSTLRVTITAARAALTGLKVFGQNAVQSGGKLRLQLVAIYRDGSARQIIPSSVAVSDAALGSINPARGEFTAGIVSADALVTVSAQYTEGGVSQSASLLIRIGSVPATLQRLSIIGARGVLASGKVLNLTAEGLYQDGSRKSVTATWQVFGSAATISADGVLTAQTVSTGTPILVIARYTDTLGTSVNAQFVMVIQPVEPMTPIDAEVESTGPKGDSGLSFWSRLVAPSSGQPGAQTTRDASATSPVYNMYVAAIVPAGGALGLPTQSIFLLNRSQEWQALGSPLAEYLSGVADNSFQLIELFDHLDATIISGTQIYVGYGTTDTEMLAAGRVRLVYQMQ